MATAADSIRRPTNTAPAEWALLPPWDGEEGTLWQVWMRDKGAVYWLMKGYVGLANFVGRREARLRRRVWHAVTNPHPLEEGGTFSDRLRAEDLCRIAHRAGKAATITPVVIGRCYPVERVAAAGDFDPFKTFDFSATEAVKSQAAHILFPVEQMRLLNENLTRTAAALRQIREASHGGSGCA